jgi:hypothetical protein
VIKVTHVLGIGAATAGLLAGFALPATGAQSGGWPRVRVRRRPAAHGERHGDDRH